MPLQEIRRHRAGERHHSNSNAGRTWVSCSLVLNGLLSAIASYLESLDHCKRSDSDEKLHHNGRVALPHGASGKAQPSENDATLLPDGH